MCFHDVVLVAMALLLAPSILHAERQYLRGRKLAFAAAGSLAIFASSQLLTHIDSTRRSLIPDPLPGDRWLQRHMGGSWHVGKSNFLDRPVGSVLTPVVMGAATITLDCKWPQGDREKDMLQDAAIYASGLLFTEGLTSLIKTAVARPRPYLRLEPELASKRTDIDVDDDRRSFFSAHVSSHMFSAVYLDKRIRQIMRDRMSASRYRLWRWAPPATLFGWVGYVGLSRIQAYQHYFSDVLVGAAVGAVAGEVFFRQGDNRSNSELAVVPFGRGVCLRYSF